MLKSMSCEKVSLCYACGDQANSYCHIKCKNFAALLQGIVAHITKYQKMFDDNKNVNPCLHGLPAYSDSWCAKVHFSEVLKQEVAVSK